MQRRRGRRDSAGCSDHARREFLRRFYEALQTTPGIEAVTISEAIARQQNFGHLSSISPGSWISANFNVGFAAALGMVLLVVSLALVVAYNRVLGLVSGQRDLQ